MVSIHPFGTVMKAKLTNAAVAVDVIADREPLQSNNSTRKSEPGLMMSAYSMKTSDNCVAVKTREVAVKEVAGLNVSRRLDMSSVESRRILKGFEDDTKKVTEQLL